MLLILSNFGYCHPLRTTVTEPGDRNVTILCTAPQGWWLKDLFKGRFRKLKTEMEINRIEDVPEIVVASCVLHYICLIDEGNTDEFLVDDEDDDYVFPPEAEGDDKKIKL